MSWAPLPTGEGANPLIRRLKAIDAEIYGALYARGGEIDGDFSIVGDLDVGGAITLGSGATFATSDAAPRLIFDIDSYGAKDFVFESGLTHEYAEGSFNVSAIEVASTTEVGALYVQAPTLGDATNRGTASVLASSSYYGAAALAKASSLSFGTWDASAELSALAVGSGDAALTLSASSGSGLAEMFLSAADGIYLASGTEFVQPSWTAPTLLNSWVNYGGGEQTMRYRKDVSGVVWVQGVIKSGTTTSGTSIILLPTGYRPAGHLQVAGVANNAFCSMKMQSDGYLKARTGWSATWTSIHFSFPT